MISLDDYNLLHDILKMKRVSNGEAALIERFVKTHIDPKCVVCKHCPAQIRFAHRQVTNWYNANKIEIEDTFAKCSKCNNPFEPTSKRNKICKNCK